MKSFCTAARMAGVLHRVRFAGGLAAGGQAARFGSTLFTRDACRMMVDTLVDSCYWSLTRELLATLPQWQGVADDYRTDECPDALPHQVFRELVGGHFLPPGAGDQLEYWAGRWEVPVQRDQYGARSLVTYNTSDGPLLYLIVLGRFIQATGQRDVLGDRFLHHPTGQVRTVSEAALRLLGSYIPGHVDQSHGWGLYVKPSRNPRQTSPSGVMRDGWDSYVHPEGSGRAADYSYMAYIENQALLYEAWQLAAEVIFPDDPRASEWLSLARDLRAATLEQFWMDRSRFFAAALDRSGRLEFESTAVPELLNGPFFDGLPDGPDYVRHIVSWLFSPAVLTPIGPRMVSLRNQPFEGPLYGYQTSGAVWSVTTGLCAKGLRRQGLPALARDLGLRRLVGWFNRAGAVPELAFVHRQTNQPVYDPAPDTADPATAAFTIPAAEVGALDQGWGASAALHELLMRRSVPDPHPDSWQAQLSRRTLEAARAVPPADAGLPELPIRVNLEAGLRLKRQRAAQLGLPA